MIPFHQKQKAEASLHMFAWNVQIDIWQIVQYFKAYEVDKYIETQS